MERTTCGPPDAGADGLGPAGRGRRLRRLRRLSLRRRFALSVGVMLLPLVNLAAAAEFSVNQLVAAVDHPLGGSPAQWHTQLIALAAARREALAAVLGVCAGGVVLAALAGRRLARAVLEPLAAIRQATERLGAGELDHRIRSDRADELGQVARAFDAMADRLQESQQRLAHSAMRDPLTGLPNRRMLHQRLAQLRGRPGPEALLLVDLDGFKTVNDSLGHSVGDQILVSTAARLQEELGDDGLCARLGGDEFALVVTCPPDAGAAVAVAERVRQVIRRPVRVVGREVVLDASIGVVTDLSATAGPGPDGDPDAGPHGGVDGDAVLRNADLAMYAGKRAGGGRVHVFTADLHAQAMGRLETEAQLREALAGDQLQPYYQPVIDLATGCAVGVEALVRWQHPDRGLVPPEEFIPLAEESDLILAVGAQVLERACTEIAGWSHAHPGAAALMLNVNVSARQLEDPALPARVRRALDVSGLPASRLTLEITETTAMRDPAASLARLRALVELGVGVAIDDFGTGHSSLAYLQRLPVRTLKLDRSFVGPLDADPAAVRLAGAVLRLADTLGLRVVAEGVERPAQAAVLRGLGAPAAQGYLYSRPAPLAALTGLLLAASSPRPDAASSPRPDGEVPLAARAPGVPPGQPRAVDALSAAAP